MTTSCMHFYSVMFLKKILFYFHKKTCLLFVKHACSHGYYGGVKCHCNLTCFVLAKWFLYLTLSRFSLCTELLQKLYFVSGLFWAAEFFVLFYIGAVSFLVLDRVQWDVVTTTALLEALTAKASEMRDIIKESNEDGELSVPLRRSIINDMFQSTSDRPYFYQFERIRGNKHEKVRMISCCLRGLCDAVCGNVWF